MSNMSEVIAREGPVVLITDERGAAPRAGQGQGDRRRRPAIR